MNARLKLKSRLWKYLLPTLLALAVAGCDLIDEDYKPFNTDPTIFMKASRIRILNLNFEQEYISVKIGGKVYQEQMLHRELTAYEETSAALLGDSIIEVFDNEGKLLLKGKLDIRFGNNYTYAIIPAYERVMSKFMLSNSQRERWMVKARTDSAVLAPIPDPILPPIADRTSARFAALALDQAQSHELFVEPIWLYNHNFNPELGTYIQYFPLTLPLIGFPPDPDFQRYDPPRYQISQYYPFEGQSISVYSPGKISFGMEYESGQAPAVTTRPFNFLTGNSYTIITNGTHGLVNDAAELTDEHVPVPLKPIPYELYILDDADGSARTLVPEEQLPLSGLSANIVFLHLNTKWKSTAMCLALDGAVYRPDQQARNDYASTFTHQTSLTGQHTLGVTAAGTVRPLLAGLDVNLVTGKDYITCFYDDQEGTALIKVIEQDTVYSPGILRVNIAHFAADLEPVKILNAATGEVLVSSLNFEGRSEYFELPIEVTPAAGEWYPLSKKVDALRVVNASTDEVLFDINLSYYDYNQMAHLLIIDGSRYSTSSMMNYTVLLSGKYHDPSAGFSKTVWGGVKNTVQTTADGGQDISYGYLNLFN